MSRSIIRITCFVVLLTCVMLCVNGILKMKHGDGIYDVTKFYEQERDSVDVLILGSSHAFEDFNTGVLWDEYGMAAYVLGGSFQPLWNTYYYLKEGLKTQKPELIVLEGYMTVFSEEYSGGVIKNSYGLKWSADKVAAIKVSTPQEEWRDFLPEYSQYHTRYTELSAADFLKNQGNPLYENWKGFGDNIKTERLPNPDVSGVNERSELYEKSEKYYRMIIELAQENDIPIVVVVSPYAGIYEGPQTIFNRAQDIAAEYGVEFINYNLCYQEIGLDYATDAADGDHLNFRGNRKFSVAVGRYLTDHYEISDRRGDSRYQSWQMGADYIRSTMADKDLCEAMDRETFLEKAQNEDYLFFISTDGECDIKNAEIHNILNTFGISYGGTNEIWQVSDNGVEWYSGEQETERYLRLDRHDICLRRALDEEENDFGNTIIVDNFAYKKVDNGVNIIVYNTVTQKVVDSVGFNAGEDYQLVR